MALMEDDTHAIKTARPSAVKERLKPSGNCRENTTALPAMADETSAREHRKEVSTKRKLATFLILVENRPIKGSRNDPKTGTKTAASIIYVSFIAYSLGLL